MGDSQELDAVGMELGPLNPKSEEAEGLSQVDKEIEEFDDLLEVVGTKGKYQKLLFYGFVCPVIGLSPLISLGPIFYLFIPDHWCYSQGMELFNATELETWKSLNLPRIIGAEGTERYSQCEMFSPDGSGGNISCPAGWSYDQSEYESTLPSEFDWVCSRDHYATNVFTTGSLGTVVGNIVFGLLTDKIGRKPVFFVSLLVYLLFRLVGFFVAHDFWTFNILHFISATGFPLAYMIPSMLIAEISDDEYRSFTASVGWGVWVTGMAALPYISKFCANWFSIGMVTTVPLLVIFLYLPFIPESVRWLVSMGRVKEASVLLQKMAKVNGNEERISVLKLEADLDRIVLNQAQNKHKNVGVWSLFGKRNLAITTLLLTVSWTMNSMIYDAITLNTPNMSGDQFFNFFVLSIIEVPSSILGGYLLGTLGRRWTQVIFFLLCGITCFVAGVAVSIPDIPAVVIISTIIAKFAITLTFLVIYLQATELFPTNLRATGNSFCGVVGSTIGMFGPTLVYLGRYYAGAPYMAMGVMSVAGVFASVFLKETLGQTLPETIEEADAFGKGNQFWSLHPNRDRKRRKSQVLKHEIDNLLAQQHQNVHNPNS